MEVRVMSETMIVTVTARYHNLAIVKALLWLLTVASVALNTDAIERIANRVLKLLRIEVRIGKGRWRPVECDIVCRMDTIRG
jgi:hypothetical protein